MHCVMQALCIVSCSIIDCVLQLCIVFCSHYALCSAVIMHCVLQSWIMFGCPKRCSAVIMSCVLQTLCTVFCRTVALINTTVTVRTLLSLYQFPTLFKSESCSHLSVRDTEAQSVSVLVFVTSPGGRHRTRSFHLGVHLVVTEM